MANIQQAIEFVLKQEDAKLTGDVTTLKGDTGGATRFGLASASHPDLVYSGYFNTKKTSRAEALSIAVQRYTERYATPLYIEAIKDQALATAILSFGVNAGIEAATRIVQGAASNCGVPCKVDGDFGEKTIAAVNAVEPDVLLKEFVRLVQQFYAALVVVRPANKRFLQGWLNRSNAWLDLVSAAKTQ